MRIFVPTRARIYNQLTRASFFLDSIGQHVCPVTYVVPESEAAKFSASHTFPDDSSVVTVPDDYRLSDVRMWLVREWRRDPFHILMDDDLVFLRRKAPLDIHQRKGGEQDAIDMLDRIRTWFERGFVHGAISQRGGNNHVTDYFKCNTRATDLHFYNAHVLWEENVQINEVVLRQDFHTTLTLLRKGYPNVVDYEFMCGQKDGQPGGCQVYRTHAMLEEQAHVLAELHPGFVTAVEKKRKGGFGRSVDVRIAWKKAFESGSIPRILPTCSTPGTGPVFLEEGEGEGMVAAV